MLFHVPTRAKIRGIIAKLEKQRRDLKEIISALREISDLTPVRRSPALTRGITPDRVIALQRRYLLTGLR